MPDKKSKTPRLLEQALATFDKVQESLDDNAVRVLRRLAEDKRAGRAFDAFHIGPEAGARIVLACIEADRLSRSFAGLLKLEKQMLGDRKKPGRLDRLGRSVRDLRNFLGEVGRGPGGPLSATIRYSDQDMAAATHGLNIVSDAISTRRRVAEETILRLGGTRKSKGKAGETAAIGWLAEGVQRCCDRPHYRATADLAEVILGCVVSLDRLRAAAQTRAREWRR
jgi:hypothetical protein